MTRQHLLNGLPKQKRGLAPPAPGLDGFSSVYASAARQLAEGRADGGTWAMPIVFLYRHAMELLIKAILTEFGPDAGVSPKRVLQRSHNLKVQMPDLERVAKRFDVTVNSEYEQLIDIWDKADAKGMKARYPITQDGLSSRFEHADAFDLQSLVYDCESALEDLWSLYDECRFAAYCEFMASESVSD